MTSIKQPEKIHNLKSGKYVGDLVYGANDGIVTTFAVVSGATGAVLAPHIIIILGLANLIADGISMGLSNYIAIHSKRDFEKKQRAIEEDEVDKMPEQEREEVREIIIKWGVPQESVESVLKTLTSNKKGWVDLMMREELGIIEEGLSNPMRHGFATGFAFIVGGSLPLIPYLFGVPSEAQFTVSIIATAISLFLVGSLRTIITGSDWLKGGVQMLLVGGAASAAAYAVGAAIKIFLGV